MNANETAEFNIRTAIAYERADNGRDKNEKLTPIKSEFTTTYHFNIASVPFRALLYTDANRTKEENEYNKKPLPHLYNARVGGASYFNGLPETNILNLCFSTPNLNLSKLK